MGCDRQSGTLDWVCEISVSYYGGMSPVLLRDHTPKGGDPVLVHGGIHVWHVLEKCLILVVHTPKGGDFTKD